ncbi:MAG: magnesium transporter CorA family protein [Holdemanella sp.]|nr:magnesium transporter CorA family protein [Holdemanella sp.]
MINFYETIDGSTTEVFDPHPGCWVNVIDPSRQELVYLRDFFKINPDFIRASIDQEERAHIDFDDDLNQCLVIADYPHYVKEEDGYETGPIGIVLIDGYIFTIGLQDHHIFDDIKTGTLRIDTHKRPRFFLSLMLRMSQKYLAYLRQIDRITTQIEKELSKSTSNEELLRMLKHEKALVYFSTSLRANELTLNRVQRGKYIFLDEDDQDLLDDVLIEIRQGAEMCSIYKEVINETMDTFSNVISNNLNELMKKLTIITMVMEIPNMVYGFYGMNVIGLPMAISWFPFVFSITMCIVAFLILRQIN